MSGLLIKNGIIADYSGERRGDVFIHDGIIQEVGDCTDFDVIDASGLYVLPAFVDLHCHLRDPGLTYKEDLESGSRAAVAGGYTTCNAMANTKPVCSSVEAVRDVMRRGREVGLIDIYQCISLSRLFDGSDIGHLEELNADPKAREDILFVSDDGYGLHSSLLAYKGLEICNKIDKVLMVHAEDHNFSKIDMAIAEDLETIRDLYLAKKLNARVHFCHVSTKESARAIIEAKRDGVRVTFEVTPHHIALNDTMSTYRVNPPIRPEDDRKFLLQCIKDGLVDAIATDHAPHTPEDKQNGSPGLVGLETAFAVCYTTLVKQEGIPLSTLSNLMSYSPARIMNINKGSIQSGVIGDVVIADLASEFTVDSNSFYTKGRNTPFDRNKYFGKIVHTIKSGRVVKL